MLHCDYELLKPLLSKGIKITKLKRWSMELADNNIMFVHIEGKNNVLLDTIFRLKALNIYKEPLQNQKTQVHNNTQQGVTEYVLLTCIP